MKLCDRWWYILSEIPFCEKILDRESAIMFFLPSICSIKRLMSWVAVTSQIFRKQALRKLSLVLPEVTTCTTARLSQLNLTVDWAQRGAQTLRAISTLIISRWAILRLSPTKVGIGAAYTLLFQTPPTPVRQVSICRELMAETSSLKIFVEPEKKGRKLVNQHIFMKIFCKFNPILVRIVPKNS